MNERVTEGRLGTTAPYNKEPRATNWQEHKQEARRDRSDRPAYPSYGMTTPQLVSAQYAFTAAARQRIAGIGSEQYDVEDHQKFEEMDPLQLLLELRDELLDAVNYLTFIDVQVERWLRMYRGVTS